MDIPFRSAAAAAATAADSGPALGPVQLLDYGWTQCRVVNTGHGLQVPGVTRSVVGHKSRSLASTYNGMQATPPDRTLM